MKAILYARAATDSQTNNIYIQIDRMKHYCRQQNIQVAGVYYDHGSANDANRVGLLKMLKNVEEGTLDVQFVICTGPDRLSRDLITFFNIEKALYKHNVEIKYLDATIIKTNKLGNNWYSNLHKSINRRAKKTRV